jgi:transposase
MTFRATVDVPARFRKSKAVGAHFGLTPRKHQSGEMDRTGRISKRGDRMVRTNRGSWWFGQFARNGCILRDSDR